MKSIIKGFWHNESGATSIEYALIAGIVSISIVGALSMFATDLNAKFASVTAYFN
jgi:pilus assembly protein Flp/PilA